MIRLVRATLWLLAVLMIAMPWARADEAVPLTEADFAIELAGGAYNLAADGREDLERVAGKAFEFYGEFPDLGIAYDRLLLDEVNFFARRDGGPVEQAHFKEGMATARGIAHGSTYAQLIAAYGEPSFEFAEHGFARVEYELVTENGDYSLDMVVNMEKDQVTDITLNCHQ